MYSYAKDKALKHAEKSVKELVKDLFDHYDYDFVDVVDVLNNQIIQMEEDKQFEVRDW
jgi:hypothetical protein